MACLGPSGGVSLDSRNICNLCIAERRLLCDRAELATTVVNAFELYYGARRSEETAKNLSGVKNLLSVLDLLGMDDASAGRPGEALASLEREGRAVDPRDLFVGCVAVQNGCAVVTNERERFGRIPGLQVLSPSEVE